MCIGIQGRSGQPPNWLSGVLSCHKKLWEVLRTLTRPSFKSLSKAVLKYSAERDNVDQRSQAVYFMRWAATSAKKLWDAVSIPQQLDGKQGRGGITPSANIAAGQNCPRDRPLFYTPTSPLFFISRHHPSWHPPAHPRPCNWEFRNINLNSTCREGKRFWYTVFASTVFDALGSFSQEQSTYFIVNHKPFGRVLMLWWCLLWANFKRESRFNWLWIGSRLFVCLFVCF